MRCALGLVWRRVFFRGFCGTLRGRLGRVVVGWRREGQVLARLGPDRGWSLCRIVGPGVQPDQVELVARARAAVAPLRLVHGSEGDVRMKTTGAGR